MFAAPDSDPTSKTSRKAGDDIAPPEMFPYYKPPAGSVTEYRKAVVVMATVEYQKQFAEFERAFLNALNYHASRDKPNYIYLRVERADVTDDPKADPAKLKWARVSVPAAITDIREWWSGGGAELADPTYLHPIDEKGLGLTHPIPPFLQRDIWDVQNHPDIPLAKIANTAPIIIKRGKARRIDGAVPDEIPLGPTDERKSSGPGMPPGAGIPPGIGPQPGGMPPGIMPPGGGLPPGGMIPGMPGMMPPGGGPAGSADSDGAVSPLAQVKYKLIRFTDFTVEAGKQYRYRVKAILDDPNRPTVFPDPPLASMDTKLRQRLKAMEPDEIKSGKKKTFVETDWSDPSRIVSLPSQEHFLASEVDPGKIRALNIGENQNHNIFTRESTATILAVKFDPNRVVDVPVEVQGVMRGATLNVTKEVTVVNPVDGAFRKLKDYPFQMNAIVADMHGGRRIPLVTKSHEEELVAPGEVLFIDSTGLAHIQDESEDIEDYRRFFGTPTKAQEARPPKGRDDSEKPKGPPGMGPPGMPPGMMPGGGGGLLGGPEDATPRPPPKRRR